jgi:hypothetical protein
MTCVPEVRLVTYAPPFSDRCPRCVAPVFVEPVYQFERAGEIRCVYQCPACWSSWWAAQNAGWLGDDYADGGVAA